MSRTLFIARLRQGLKGLSPNEIDDIVLDYEAHFSDAVADGRNETEVAASLGDALRLGGELSAETKLQRWEGRRSPRTFVQAGLGLMGLKLKAGLAAYVLYIVGSTGIHLLGGLLSGNGNVLVPALVGLGLICGVVGIGGLIAMLLDGGLRLLGRYMRLNYRLLKPDEGEE